MSAGQSTPSGSAVAVRVPDMTCGHCVATIQSALKGADPQAQVRIDLAAHRVEIDPVHADTQALRLAIEDAGYSPVPAGGDATP